MAAQPVAHSTGFDYENQPVSSNNIKTKEGGRSSVDRSAETAEADDLLAVLGYQSELSRNRSTWQVAFMSFVLASVPYGLATTLYYPLIGGGPSAIIWGWVLVCCIIICVAISLGEITSVYPTAGGVYYQTYMLSPPWCRNITAWICGWAYVLGNITITLAVNFGTTLFLVGCVNIFQDSEGNGVWAATNWQIWLTFVGITLLCNATSSLGNRWLPYLDTFAIFWTFAGVICIVVCALSLAKGGRNKASFAFGGFEASSGWTPGWSWCIGLLHGAYATSATGMILSMCEEVREPATQVPKAMVGTIVLNAICGFIFLVPLCFVLPPIEDVVAASSPVPYILKIAIGNDGGAFALTVPLLVLAFFCGVGCTTAASRCTWAFARDGAIPGSRYWKQVHPKLDVPLNAMMLSMVVQIILGVIYFGSVAAFNAFSGVGVIFLTISYTMPILVSLLGGRKALKQGHYDFGAAGVFCNIVAICWCLFITPLFSMPSFLPTTADTMNYASVVFVGGVSVSAAWYFIWGRANYQGPPAKEEEVARRRSSVISAH
ncbi:uncharacterized protein A1O9_01211 [Exophiala aquamarina CBS 119918]|uniref:Amino acid permease n=1 Tax=Exophiala aquamarina CBS 119918 TaxID=1182545 RepID=A0A072PT21_9EURO|nr:uncharacterized protein A1O9_01211 [Exophiala aquamarina CBS 119918]KEF63234.1 hypothetical protein A1O9_01211 [Exophiala aquamarina CBS 119918]